MEGYFFHSLILDVIFFLTTLPASASLTLFFSDWPLWASSVVSSSCEHGTRCFDIVWISFRISSSKGNDSSNFFQKNFSSSHHSSHIIIFQTRSTCNRLLKTFTCCTFGESQLSNTLQESIALHLKASTHTTLTESILFLWNSIRQKKSNTSVSCANDKQTPTALYASTVNLILTNQRTESRRPLEPASGSKNSANPKPRKAFRNEALKHQVTSDTLFQFKILGLSFYHSKVLNQHRLTALTAWLKPSL